MRWVSKHSERRFENNDWRSRNERKHMQIVYFAPMVLDCEQHLQMLENQFVQSELLKTKLAAEKIDLTSVVVFDSIGDAYLEMSKKFKFTRTFLPFDLAGPRGIRRPTNFCIEMLSANSALNDCYLLRLTQEAYITDIDQVINGLLECINEDTSIGGDISTANDPHHHLEKMGLQARSEYSYVQGAFMFASLRIWRQFYLPMSGEIAHCHDDLVMSQWFHQTGGRYRRISGFVHLHAADEATLLGIRTDLSRAPGDTLTEIYSRFHSPQSDKGSAHSYLETYDELFGPLKHQPIRLLEIGVDRGGSLALWARFFTHKNCEIIGVDINAPVAVNDKRVKVYQGDAASFRFINEIDGTFNIVIDDGSHVLEDQIRSFYLLSGRLANDGIYVIEDLQNNDAVSTINRLVAGFDIIDLRHVKNRYDDVLMIYKKQKRQ
jgi:hypothetical protein